MNPRHTIIDDREFWQKLERAACVWLCGAGVKRLWFDGFIPETARDTQAGADIEGIAWVGDGPRLQHEYRFVASVPQKLLHRRKQFHIDDIVIDEAKKRVALSLSAVSSPNQTMKRIAAD